MAKEHSMDISIQFDLQEVINSVDQTKKEALNRYDLKDAGIEIELGDDLIKVTAQGEIHIEAVYGVLVKKMVGRGVSPRILDRQKIEEIGGLRVRQEMHLIKALDQDTAKKISKMIKENFPKTKPIIQGEIIRVNSSSIDELQAIMSLVREDETLTVPLEFGNYR